MFLAAYVAVIAVPMAVFLGLLAAVWQGGIFDHAINVMTLITIPLPEYLLAYILVRYLAVRLPTFPRPSAN